MKQKCALVLGGGGFIGGHLAKRLKEEGYWVRIADIKPKHEYWNLDEICDDYISCDLTDPTWVSAVMRLETFKVNKTIIYTKGHYHKQPNTDIIPFDEVYQLAADMGGAGYIFTGENDANVMHNSALINLNVAAEAISWLCTYAKPAKTGDQRADMLFFETKDGFQFRSIASIYKDRPYKTYTYNVKNIESQTPEQKVTSVLDYQFVKDFDSLNEINSGTFVNRVMAF